MNKLTKKSKIWLGFCVGALLGIIVLANLTNMGVTIKDSGKHIINIIEFVLSIFLVVSLFYLLMHQKTTITNTIKSTSNTIKRQNASKSLMGIIIAVFGVLTLFGSIQILGDTSCSSCNVYKLIGFILIMLWLTIFLCYFIWAIYFYNLNLGKTNSEWAKINEAKNNRANGQPYSQHIIDEEPTYNPYADETFGIPKGTVRGMIAFTLLFGAVALLIVSFGMSSEVVAGSFFVDQFEFFKTAFLMMIAFYFGSRSLQYLRNGKGGPVQAGTAVTQTDATLSTGGNVQDVNTTEDPKPKSDIVVVQPDEDKEEPKDGSVPPIVPIDPMAPKK